MIARASIQVLLLSLLGVAPLGAQEPETNPDEFASPLYGHLGSPPWTISLAVGPQHLQVVEELLFGRRASGPGIAVALTVNRVGHVATPGLEVSLEGVYGTLSNADDLPTTTADVTAAVRWHFWQPTGSFPLVVGGYVRGSTALQFHEQLDESHVYWLTAYEVGPSAATTFHTCIGTIDLSAALPVVAFVSRPEAHRLYNNDMPGIGDVLSTAHEDLTFATPGSYRGLVLEVGLQQLVVETLIAKVGYRFSYHTAREPRPISLLSHTVSLSLSLEL